jgi:hypothetical protein
MICIRCSRSFMPKRADAVTCSNKCRQALHRKRHASATRRVSVTGKRR